MDRSIERVDDLTEVLAYYINTYGKPIPNSLKKGVADKLLGFDEYQLAKYNRDSAVKLKDLLCLVHPRAKSEEQNTMFKRLLEDKLETPRIRQFSKEHTCSNEQKNPICGII
ncbi:TROVE domain protein [Desulfosporosinus acididurans]|uniref:TROVE domain protein n=1 Tax=Desulfosporosinus acididurans TaxID=476652 RepID=A0A0J1FR51_9FIRM|nr:TROVE domain protein [Desulfosporosinus acididurans]